MRRTCDQQAAHRAWGAPVAAWQAMQTNAAYQALQSNVAYQALQSDNAFRMLQATQTFRMLARDQAASEAFLTQVSRMEM